MAKMVNIADIPLRVAISTMPGQPPMVTELGPGEAAQFPDGYCKPVRGAGPDLLPSVLERSHRHLGVSVLVPEAQAATARARYEQIKAAQAGKDPQTELVELRAKLAAQEQVAKLVAPLPAPKPPPKSAPLPAPAAAAPASVADATTPKPKPRPRPRRKAAKVAKE